MKTILQKSSKSSWVSYLRRIVSTVIPINLDKNLFKVTGSLGTLTLFSLAIPIMVESLMNIMISTVNTIVLSGFSEEAMVAVGTAGNLLNNFSIVFTVVATGATSVVSNLIGAEKLHKASQAASVAIICCALLATFCAACLLVFAPQLLMLMNLEQELFDMAVPFFRIRVAFLPVMAATSILCAIMRCHGNTKITVIVGLSTNVINLLLNVFVTRFPEYTPVTGAVGVGCACVVSQAIGLILTIGFFRNTKIKLNLPDSLREAWVLLLRILRVGVPTGFSQMTYSISQTVSISFVALMGTYALTARTYYITLIPFAYLFGSSFGQANALMIGRLCGAGKYDTASKTNRQLIRITCRVNLLMSMLLLLFRVPLLSIFTDIPEVFEMAGWIFLIDIVAEQARGLSHVYEYALSGAGDALFMMNVTSCSCVVCGIGLSYFLGITCNLGVIGCWIATAVDECVRTVASLYRWRSQKWISNRMRT